ncbi:hypothetical protein PSTG_10963 [Puccinia striiformis f. sp. tritici PST-78]|uniref:Uncharacterized protein n=1 Tax=Puccinia striiformis f. sp. tritici PST-78 TaxID=1165861 RepID=A0A0L0V8Y1_9BASI|nr:hypothetical protein PSTG_10963 [Puccinia striiformis f. sp. tritici PST-78]
MGGSQDHIKPRVGGRSRRGKDLEVRNNSSETRFIDADKTEAKKGKTFILWTDNTTAENAIHKRKLRDKFMNDGWKIIQKILIKHELNFIARRVASAENKADGLSRGKKGSHRMKDMVRIHVPSDLIQMLDQVVPE